MKNISIVLLAVSLAGCASVPRPQSHVVHRAKPAVAKSAPAPASPNQVVKKRWSWPQWKWVH